MSEYCKCKDCEYLDTTEKKGCKYYCDWYKTYEDPDKIHECQHYKEQ